MLLPGARAWTYGRALRKEPDRLRSFGRRPGKCIPRHRKGADDANGKDAEYLMEHV